MCCGASFARSHASLLGVRGVTAIERRDARGTMTPDDVVQMQQHTAGTWKLFGALVVLALVVDLTRKAAP